MSTLKVLTFVIVVIVAALAGALIARNLRPATTPALEAGTRLQTAQPLPEFLLTDQDGRAFGKAQLRGHWSFIFFGFTNCGDVCPTTLALLAATSKSLSDLPIAEHPQVVFISVDAKRDRPEVVKSYVRSFSPDFVGVSGEQSKIDTFTKTLGVPSAIRPLENGTYAVDHSAAIFAINPNGELTAVFTPPQ